MAEEPAAHPLFTVRKGQGSTKLTKEEFRRRWQERFYNPAFDRPRCDQPCGCERAF